MKQYCVPLGVYRANCYIIIDEKSNTAAVIDPGDYEETLAGILESEKIKSVKYILLTHGHYDHVLGVYNLKKHTDAQVAIHSDDAACLWDEHESLADHVGADIQKYLSPDLKLEDGMNLFLGETCIKVLHTPGHTRGGVCFLLEAERKLFTGDTLFCRTIGRTDFTGGDLDLLLSSVSRLAELDGDYDVYPGHNRSTTLEAERQHNRFVRKIK